MIKVKFRVYEYKYCRNCKTTHLQPKQHRVIYYQSAGSKHDVIQRGHASAVALLDKENDEVQGLHQRPLYQWAILIGG